MEILFALNEMVEILFLIIGLKYLYEFPTVALKKNRELLVNVGLIIICVILYAVLFDAQGVYFFLRFTAIVVYVYLTYRRYYVDTICKVIVLLFCTDVLNLLFAFVTYPVAIVLQLKAGDVASEVMALIIDVIGYLIVLLVIVKRKPVSMWNFIGSAKKGIFIICMVVEIVFIGMKTAVFRQEDAGLYLLWTLFIIFGATILVLWLRDKKKQHDKMADLISYEHRTREIIPAIEKTLRDVKNMGLTKEEEAKIIEELRAVCKSDLAKSDLKQRRVRSFATTGSAMLDNQMEQYIEEAFADGIMLDIIVRARIADVLKEEEIEIYPIMQIVGDLYRNAYKAVAGNKDNKNILFCFGYNQDGFYEIGIYDNGHPFPRQILERFGQRGNTVGGTGHGIADVLERLNKYRISFILEENPASGTMFTKGIHIIFNDEANVEIK